MNKPNNNNTVPTPNNRVKRSNKTYRSAPLININKKSRSNRVHSPLKNVSHITRLYNHLLLQQNTLTLIELDTQIDAFIQAFNKKGAFKNIDTLKNKLRKAVEKAVDKQQKKQVEVLKGGRTIDVCMLLVNLILFSLLYSYTTSTTKTLIEHYKTSQLYEITTNTMDVIKNEDLTKTIRSITKGNYMDALFHIGPIVKMFMFGTFSNTIDKDAFYNEIYKQRPATTNNKNNKNNNENIIQKGLVPQNTGNALALFGEEEMYGFLETVQMKGITTDIDFHTKLDLIIHRCKEDNEENQVFLQFVNSIEKEGINIEKLYNFGMDVLFNQKTTSFDPFTSIYRNYSKTYTQFIHKLEDLKTNGERKYKESVKDFNNLLSDLRSLWWLLWIQKGFLSSIAFYAYKIGKSYTNKKDGPPMMMLENGKNKTSTHNKEGLLKSD